MNVADQDRPKVIILTLAIVAMVAVAVVRLYPLVSRSGASAPAPAAAGQQTASTQAGAQLSPEDALEARQTMLEQLEASDTPPGPAGRDPFRPPPGAVSTAQAAARQAAPPQVERRRPEDSLPSGVFQPTNPGLPELGSRPAPVAMPPLPQVTVRGVISGDPAVAILTLDQQTFHKMEGEPLGGGLILARITDYGVVIKYGKRNYPVDVGHSVQPERSTAPAAAPSSEPRRVPEPRSGAVAPPARAEAPTAEPANATESAPPASVNTPHARTSAPTAETAAPSTERTSAAPRRSVRRAARRVVRPQPIYRFSGRRL